MSFSYNSIVLTVMNSKGGCAKSTTSTILAEYFALIKGKKVLLIDLDQQANTSDLWVGMDRNEHNEQVPPIHPEYDISIDLGIFEPRSSIGDIYFGKEVFSHETFIKSDDNKKGGSVEVIMSHPDILEKVNSEVDNKSGHMEKRIINRLKEFLHDDSVSPNYDIIILDTGPTKSPLFRSCIRAATHIIIPTELEAKSIQGIDTLTTIIEHENSGRKVSDELKIVGLIASKVRMNTNLHKSNFEFLHEKLPGIMPPKDIYMSLSSAFPERDLRNINPRSIFNISKKHNARIQSEALGDYVNKKIFG
jgi:chromosome partitioning protein